MTYYSRQHETTDAAEREIDFLACNMIARDVGGNGNSISDMVFWYGRSPALIRHVIEVALPKKGYHLEYWLWFDEIEAGSIEDEDDYKLNQNVDVCVRLKGDNSFNFNWGKI